MVRLFDSVDLDQIPSDAAAVAGYVDGQWRTFAQLVARWPHARRVSIATSPLSAAEVLDVEKGDAAPADVVWWIKRMRALGYRRPCIYADMSTMRAAVIPLLDSTPGLSRPSYRLWVADWTGEPHRPAGFGACQWTSSSMGRNLDESSCAWWFLR